MFTSHRLATTFSSLNTLSGEEREALSHLFDLHARAMQIKSLCLKLKGLLYANSYRNREEEHLAHLREEARFWHAIRRQATRSRLLQAG